ncbi:MAG: DUF1269 domain-containing protein [Sphingorhabdus sp.]
MSELIVLGFKQSNEADHVLTDLGRLRKEHLIDLDDAVVAIRDPDGKVHIKQSINVVARHASFGTLSGALWGSLIGLLFMNPLAGMAIGGVVGAGTGVLSGSLVDYGINDDFIRDLGKTLSPDSSALFLLIRKAQPEKVLAELSHYRATILRSSLSPEQEERLIKAISRDGAAKQHDRELQPA